MDDHELLAQYVTSGSHDAFAALVERHMDLVWSSALRLTGGDPHRAEDVAQTVFTALAVKAHGLKAGVVLAGWLLNATRFAAADLLKAEGRRKRHERKAAMGLGERQAGTAGEEWPCGGQERVWAEVAPVLDEALARLSESLRLAVVLRYFRKLSMRDVAQCLGISEPAARQRVCRGLDELRNSLARRSMGISAAALGMILTAHAVEAAPAGVAATVASLASLEATAAAQSMSAAGKTGVVMAWFKGGVAAGVLVVLLGSGTALLWWELFGKTSDETVILAPPAVGSGEAAGGARPRGPQRSIAITPGHPGGAGPATGKSITVVLEPHGSGAHIAVEPRRSPEPSTKPQPVGASNDAK